MGRRSMGRRGTLAPVAMGRVFAEGSRRAEVQHGSGGWWWEVGTWRPWEEGPRQAKGQGQLGGDAARSWAGAVRRCQGPQLEGALGRNGRKLHTGNRVAAHGLMQSRGGFKCEREREGAAAPGPRNVTLPLRKDGRISYSTTRESTRVFQHEFFCFLVFSLFFFLNLRTLFFFFF